MHYDLKEFYPEFSIEFKTIKKNLAQKAFVKYIFNVLNQRKYSDIESFYSQNPNFQTFLINYINYTGKSNVIALKNSNALNLHFGQTLTEEDYQLIMKSILKLTEKKRSFNEEKIKTTKVDDKEISSYTNANSSTYLINNSDKKIEEQLKEKQLENESFQTPNPDVNAQNMFQDLKQHTKESLDFVPIKDIISKIDDLTEEERKFVFQIVDNSQDIENIKVDLQKKMYVDSAGNVSTIKSEDGIDKVYGGEENTESLEKTNSYQKTLTLFSEKNNIAS